MIPTDKDIINSTIEAIYWWNITEHHYHRYFNKIDYIYKNEHLLIFFTAKVFETFLKEYSINRKWKIV
ncbi:MAG TPA: hypothetical protein VIL99_03580 [Ignavibacteria bacterium]